MSAPPTPCSLQDMSAVIRQTFGDIPNDELEALCRVIEVRAYPAGHVLCTEGALERVFYIVAAGQAAITQQLGQEQRVVALRGPGEFFGEMALIEHKPRTASVTALADMTVLEISEDTFNNVLIRNPKIALTMIRRLAANLRTADQAALADLLQKNIELAKAYDDLKAAQRELVAKERLERELEIAGEVQRNLLPSIFPSVPGFAFAARNVPARHVGGDLYDVIKVDDGHVGLLMADVSDKSVHAALLMAVTRALFLAHARRSLSPAEVTLAVHDSIMEISSKDDMFVTVFYGVLDWQSGELCYVRAGQDKPLLLRAAGGMPQMLDAPGRFLGMIPDLKLEERQVQLQPGDLLVAYSDGVTDAVGTADRPYGLQRLLNLLFRQSSASAEAICDAILDDVFSFRGIAPAFDDITVLVAKCLPQT